MDITSAATLARSLMVEHGVGSVSFGFHSYPAERIGLKGCTIFVPIKVANAIKWIATDITLSYEYTLVLPEDEVRNIILHEIAHVKAGRYAGHGPAWETECFKLGIQPIAEPQSLTVVPNWNLYGWKNPLLANA